MTTETFSPVELTEDAFVLVADGATYQTVGIQMGEEIYGFAVALGAALPAADSDAYIVLKGGKDISWERDLDAASNIYARSLKGNSKLRGYRVSR